MGSSPFDCTITPSFSVFFFFLGLCVFAPRYACEPILHGWRSTFRMQAYRSRYYAHFVLYKSLRLHQSTEFSRCFSFISGLCAIAPRFACEPIRVWLALALPYASIPFSLLRSLCLLQALRLHHYTEFSRCFSFTRDFVLPHHATRVNPYVYGWRSTFRMRAYSSRYYAHFVCYKSFDCTRKSTHLSTKIMRAFLN